MTPEPNLSQHLLRRLRWPLAIAAFILGTIVLQNLLSRANDKDNILVEGESPLSSNFNYVVNKNRGFSNGASLEFINKDLPPNQNGLSLIYRFNVNKEGVYWVVAGGTPPGTLKEGARNAWFSPYWISFDGKEPMHLTQEIIDETYGALYEDRNKWVEYSKGGYHWTRLGIVTLEPGKHTLEIHVNEGRKQDGQYALYLDAIFMAPKSWKPIRTRHGLSRQLFYEVDNILSLD